MKIIARIVQMKWLLIFLSILQTACTQTAQIQIGPENLMVEIANTDETRAKGLSGRKLLEEGTGMLFVYQQPRYLEFWMKDTWIPLSIAFFNEKKELINMADMDPLADASAIIPRYASTAPAAYVLEVPQGWFEKHGIKKGMKFRFADFQK